MKKRLLAMILSALLVVNISACSDVSDGASKKITEQTMQAAIEQESSTPPQEESQNKHPDILLPPPVLENYSDILNEYKNLLIYEQEHGLSGFGNPSQKGEPTEIWETLAYSAKATKAESAGYCIKDLNNDASPELILISSDYRITAIFTIVNGLPKSLGAYGVGNQIVLIDENGKIYTNGYGKAENWYTIIEQISEDGSVITFIFGCYDPNIDGDYDPLDLEYYQICNGERSVINKSQLDDLLKEYRSGFLDFDQVLQHTGFEPTLVFQ